MAGVSHGSAEGCRLARNSLVDGCFSMPRRGSQRHSGRALLAVLLLLLLGLVLAGGGVYFWSEQQLRAAQQALANEDLDSAQYYLERCLKYRPNHSTALFLAARTA